MDFAMDFYPVRSQKLLLTPHLKQALDILRMSSQELQRYVEEQAESNPLIEIVTGEEGALDDTQADTAENPEWEEEASAAIDLKEHLLLQLDALNLEKGQRKIGEYLIDNVDENGYLTIEVEEVAAFFHIASHRVEKVLQRLQALEPQGVCARNLRECLLIQLVQMENVCGPAVRIVENYLDELAGNDTMTVANAEKLPVSAVEEAFRLIKTLEPRPGREYYHGDTIRNLVPDVLVRVLNNDLKGMINEEAVPSIHVHQDYRGEEMAEMDGKAGSYIRNCLHEAMWLVKCIEQRKELLLKITEELLKQQTSFFRRGEKYLETLDPEDFAEKLELHGLLLENAIQGKYLQCSFGAFELRRFFKEGKVEA